MIAVDLPNHSWSLNVAEPPTHFARKLIELRTAAGVSAYRLAQLTGISRQALSQLETGQTIPTWETVQKIARALGLNCEAFEDPGLELPEAPEPKKAGRPRKGQGHAPAEGKKPRGRGKAT
jgi:transcriptional regulator with XRE-family HTH domain